MQQRFLITRLKLNNVKVYMDEKNSQQFQCDFRLRFLPMYQLACKILVLFFGIYKDTLEHHNLFIELLLRSKPISVLDIQNVL